MKKSLVALAALAVVSAASAQSSVTLYGVLDAAYNRLSATDAGVLSRVTGTGGNVASRIGFRGVEDLGGGLKASFVLEAGINVDNGTGVASPVNSTVLGQNLNFGTGVGGGNPLLLNPASSGAGLQGLTFNRRSTVSLEGGFGEIRVGRDLTPSFVNLAAFDPFTNVGVGSALNVILGSLNPAGNSVAPPGSPKPQIRASNSIGYFTPSNLGGFYGQAMYAFSEVPTSCSAFGAVAAGGAGPNSCFGAKGDGKYLGLRGGYANGPVNVAFGYGKTTYANDPTVPLGLFINNGVGAASQFRGNYTAVNLGGSYDFGVAKAMAQWGTQVQQANLNQGFNSFGAVNAAALPQDQKLTHYLLGVSVPVGAGEFKASYNWGKVNSRALIVDNERKQNQLALGYVYNLSKRTAVYTSLSRLTASGLGATATQALTSSAVTATSGNVTATGYDIGIRHSF